MAILTHTESGTWLPAFVPGSSRVIAILLVLCSAVNSTTGGYDGSMMNGLNILPSYTTYFSLTPATTGLLTSSVFIGGTLASLLWGPGTDFLGRRPALLYSSLLTLVAVLLQAAAQNTGMFVFARILIGVGNTMAAMSGPAYLAETLPLHWRAWGLGVFNDFYYVGGLIAAGVTYGTAGIENTWAWRAPSAVQAATSVLCILILPFVPESPRWLVHRGEHAAALRVVAQTYADGDEGAAVVLAVFKEIADTLGHERDAGETMTFGQLVRTPVARRRVWLACSGAVFSVVAGNVISSYYLGDVLGNAGIEDAETQLKINIVLNVWCLACSILGTWMIDRWGRKPTAIVCQTFLTIMLFILGALTAVYGNSGSTSGVYGTVAAMFLFQGAYSIGWTPLLNLYPPEVLSFPIRSLGLGMAQLANNCTAVLIVFTMPIALGSIGWKLYMINGAWDVVVIGMLAYWWVETKGKTLEEIDEIFEGRKHSDVADVERIYKGEETINVESVAAEVNLIARGRDATREKRGDVAYSTTVSKV